MRLQDAVASSSSNVFAGGRAAASDHASSEGTTASLHAHTSGGMRQRRTEAVSTDSCNASPQISSLVQNGGVPTQGASAAQG